MSRWRRKDLQEIQSQIRDELASLNSDSMQDRLKYILDQVAVLDNDLTIFGQQRRYFLVIFALVHHERFGGIPKPKLNQLYELAYALLTVNRIKPQTSKLSYLFSELNLVMSQIYLKEGLGLKSVWQQAMAKSFGGEQFPGGDGFYHLSMGIRLHHLGFMDQAVDHLRIAAESHLNGSSISKSRAYLVKSLRLSNSLSDAKLAIAKYKDLESNQDFINEFIWEKECIKMSQTQSLDACLQLIKKDASHYQGTYVLEAYLWSRALQSTVWTAKFFKVKTYAKHFNLKASDSNLLLCQCLEDAYDSSIDFIVRVKKLGECLTSLDKSVGHQNRLLFLLSAARWLQRFNQYQLARIAISEYTALSFRLSQGQSNNVLGIGGDLIDKVKISEVAS